MNETSSVNATSIFDLLSLDNEVFRSYIFYSSLLVMKVFLLVPLTAIQRIKYMNFANPEDTKIRIGFLPKPSVSLNNEHIERIRRAHLNDLENIPFFVFSAFFYILTGPSVFVATTLFKIVTLLRFVHTFVYAVIVIPQPARFLSFIIPYFLMFHMCFTAVIHFWDEN
ncbi:microsomal glutathione S-transferase 1-like [Bradysia coprophila]|uniref:microsomal glutathione S-transferase 1-like n=1 Tax=Bradysia coprophila TaxID=38358 RepID=UPI00187D93DE|nr:microsomal glutathione S-transferase 1-like [Bradysia coprophila]